MINLLDGSLTVRWRFVDGLVFLYPEGLLVIICSAGFFLLLRYSHLFHSWNHFLIECEHMFITGFSLLRYICSRHNQASFSNIGIMPQAQAPSGEYRHRQEDLPVRSLCPFTWCWMILKANRQIRLWLLLWLAVRLQDRVFILHTVSYILTTIRLLRNLASDYVQLCLRFMAHAANFTANCK